MSDKNNQNSIIREEHNNTFHVKKVSPFISKGSELIRIKKTL